VAKQRQKIYRRRRPLRTLLRILGVTILGVGLLLVASFFRFQRYIVHTAEGVRLDIPFLRAILDELPEPLAPDAPVYTPATPPAHIEDESFAVPEQSFRSVFLTAAALDEMLDWSLALQDLQVDRVLVPLNDPTGTLHWDSDVSKADRFALNGQADIAAQFAGIDPDIGRSALLYGFRNSLLVQRNPEAALYGQWLNPANAEIRAYLTELALELGGMGFDEIVLTDFGFPADYAYRDDEVILGFLRDLARALRNIGVELSVMTQEADWLTSEEDAPFFRPSLVALSGIVSRFYCVLEPETIADTERLEALHRSAQAVLGADISRFVPAGSGFGPESGNWMTQFG